MIRVFVKNFFAFNTKHWLIYFLRRFSDTIAEHVFGTSNNYFLNNHVFGSNSFLHCWNFHLFDTCNSTCFIPFNLQHLKHAIESNCFGHGRQINVTSTERYIPLDPYKRLPVNIEFFVVYVPGFLFQLITYDFICLRFYANLHHPGTFVATFLDGIWLILFSASQIAFLGINSLLYFPHWLIGYFSEKTLASSGSFLPLSVWFFTFMRLIIWILSTNSYCTMCRRYCAIDRLYFVSFAIIIILPFILFYASSYWFYIETFRLK